MADVTVHPQTPLNISQIEEKADEKTEEEEDKIVLSPSVSIILENPLFSIDPFLLIRICSFLDMISVMRFECVSLRLSKFLKKNIKLQSLHETNTDYFIDHALHSPSKIEEENTSSDDIEEIIPIYSELKYRFPNPSQYDHYILLETDNNIFAPFQHIKQLYLKIIPPDSKDLVSNPSSSYLSKYRKHKEMMMMNTNEENKENEENIENEENEENVENEEESKENMNYLLLNSLRKREYASRPPITKVETSIYSRSIFGYFDNYFNKIDNLIIEFNPYIFTSTFLTFNIPKILSKISHLSLIKSLPNIGPTDFITSRDIYCHEMVSLLQYTRNLKELTFNFPLSSDFYPIINNLESLKIMHRIEQPFIMENELKTDLIKLSPSPYAQNIVTINNHKTTLISNVKLQKSLIQYFSPSITSLHLHGSKGLQQLSLLTHNIDANGVGDEDLNISVQNKHKVFFGLNELCIHCSDSIYQFITKYMNVVPQLKRLQLVFGKNCSISQFILILNHFHSNCVLNYTYNPNKDNLLSYYYNYYIYYGYNLSNSAKQLRYIHVITKKTKHYQNYQLLNGLCSFLKKTKITLLHIRLLIQYQYWSTSDLMNIIELFSKNNIIFGRDSMSYQIIMPLKRQYQQHAAFTNNTNNNNNNQQSQSSSVKKKIKDIKDDYKYKQSSKYSVLNDDDNNNKIKKIINTSYNGVIDKNSLKGIASYVKQKNVGKLQIITSETNMRDEDIVIIEKLRIESQSKQKYQSYKEFLYSQNEEYRNNNNNNNDDDDDRKIYKDKITKKLLSNNNDNDNDNNDNDKDKDKMFVKDIVKNINDSEWINECYYCDLLK